MYYRTLATFACIAALAVFAIQVFSEELELIVANLVPEIEADQPAAELVEATFTESDLTIRSLHQTDHYEAPVGRFQLNEIDVAGESRVWHGLAAEADGPRPVVILLHGSNRNGAAMLDMWQAAARSEGVHLIAPDSKDSRIWSDRSDGEDFIRAVLNDAGRQMQIDPEQIYLFGHSAGGTFALSLANGSDLPWQAVATHGNAYRNRAVAPEGPVPLRLYLGDRDHTATLDQARDAGERLAALGHPTELIVLNDHGHWYYDIGTRLSYRVMQWFLAPDDQIAQQDS